MVDRTTELVGEHKSMISHEAESRTPLTPEQVRQQARLAQFDLVIEDAREVFIDRNRIYKDTFIHLGVLGTTVTLVGDVFRLRNMIIHEPDHGRGHVEQIEDKLIDVINQAVISLMMLKEQNFEGD